MRTLAVLEWMSLDGVYDANYMNDFFMPYHSEERGNYIRDCILNCDDYLLGKHTYEMLAPYWSTLKNNEMGVADKLNAVSKIVVSTTLKKALWNNSTLISKNAMAEIKQLKEKQGRDILVAGSGTLVASLMKAGLVDEFRLLVHPYLVGGGELFFKQDTQQALELVSCQTLPLGVLLQVYRVKKD